MASREDRTHPPPPHLIPPSKLQLNTLPWHPVAGAVKFWYRFREDLTSLITQEGIYAAREDLQTDHRISRMVKMFNFIKARKQIHERLCVYHISLSSSSSLIIIISSSSNSQWNQKRRIGCRASKALNLALVRHVISSYHIHVSYHVGCDAHPANSHTSLIHLLLFLKDYCRFKPQNYTTKQKALYTKLYRYNYIQHHPRTMQCNVKVTQQEAQGLGALHDILPDETNIALWLMAV